ncbi:MAG TPA: glycosyltransferase family 4 protein [Candidatus Saccharimonadales bacterium]|nr:glycosyltransferase family 4 protein [Candidatus Saccharimonadales bacterium]
MRVGIIGPIWLDIPPKAYGGTEEVVANLANGLVDNGHDVTVFGPANTNLKSKLVPTAKQPLRNVNIEWDNLLYTLYHISEAFDRADEFDILHMHLNKSQDYMALPFAALSKTPVLFTFHFRLPSIEETPPDRYGILDKYKEFPFTSISNSQRKPMPQLNFIKTIYNSLDMPSFPFIEKPQGDYFVWLGKINPLKGTKEAILAAKKAGVKLYVLGAVDKGVPEMFNYYEQEVKPLFDEKQIIWKGEVFLKEKTELLGNAKAFLNPIQWEEPFGLVMAEAQATGTPVISFNRGAAPEVIIDGKTGFLVNTLDEMVEKMKIIDTLDRYACRKNVEDTFSIPNMAKGYEEAYQTTIDNWEEYKRKQRENIELYKNKSL